jgi:hypothetical protein
MKPATSATLITCLRNEGPFLIEWLAYHRAIGFDRFIIGANDCTDGSHEMLTRLAAMGEVIYLPFSRDPAGKGPQYQFADLLAATGQIKDGDWLAWLDLDEFLLIHRGDGSVQRLIRDLGKADGIRINWRYFGVPPGVAWPGRQIHPALCRCAPADFAREAGLDHRTFKSLYRHRDGLAFFAHGPIYTAASLERRPDWRDGKGKTQRRRAWPRKRLKIPAGVELVTTSLIQHDWAQINHYATRHPAFAQMRRQRGRGSAFVPTDPTDPFYQDFAARHSDAYFATYNQHSDHDPRILRHLPAIDAQMGRLLADQTLRHWHDHALRQLPPEALAKALAKALAAPLP